MTKVPPGFRGENGRESSWMSLSTSLDPLVYIMKQKALKMMNLPCNAHKPHLRLLQTLCNPQERSGYAKQTFLPTTLTSHGIKRNMVNCVTHRNRGLCKHLLVNLVAYVLFHTCSQLSMA